MPKFNLEVFKTLILNIAYVHSKRYKKGASHKSDEQILASVTVRHASECESNDEEDDAHEEEK